MAYQHYTEWNLVYRVYYPAFYTKRSLGAIYREYCLANLKCKLPTRPKKSYESHTNRGRGKRLGKAAPPSVSSEMGKKKDKRGRRGSSSSTKNTKLVFT